MPFHVNYTGSSPLSTYFIVKPVHQPEGIDNASSSPSFTQRARARFTSAFRGRTIQGVNVDIPDGYSGIVFKTEELGMGKETDVPPKRLASAKGKQRKGRRTTRGSYRNVDNVDGDGDGDINMEGPALKEDNGVMQTLLPMAKFSSLTLWNADIDVDEGRDEYLRTLSEYQRLLHEVRASRWLVINHIELSADSPH